MSGFIYIVEKTEIHCETWPIAAFSDVYKANKYAKEMDALEKDPNSTFHTYKCLSVDPEESD